MATCHKLHAVASRLEACQPAQFQQFAIKFFPYCMQFNSPVEVNWEYMDSSIMQRFWKNHEEERADVASISDRILVFHRGISTVVFMAHSAASPLCPCILMFMPCSDQS